MSYLAFVSITPIGKGESVSHEVAKAYKVIKESGLNYQLTSMGTIMESDNIEEIFQILKEAIQTVEKDNNRVSVIIKLDCRKNFSNRIDKKIKSVIEKL